MRYFIVMYYQQPDGKHREQVKTHDTIRKGDLERASLILDYKERKIVKCRFDGELGDKKDFDHISEFYKGHYLDLVSQLEAKYELIEATAEILKSGVVADVLAEANDTK